MVEHSTSKLRGCVKFWIKSGYIKSESADQTNDHTTGSGSETAKLKKSLKVLIVNISLVFLHKM